MGWSGDRVAVLQLDEVREQVAGTLDQLRAGGRWHEALGRALEQRRAELVLDPEQRAADRRLREVEERGRADRGARLGEREHELEVADLEARAVGYALHAWSVAELCVGFRRPRIRMLAA